MSVRCQCSADYSHTRDIEYTSRPVSPISRVVLTMVPVPAPVSVSVSELGLHDPPAGFFAEFHKRLDASVDDSVLQQIKLAASDSDDAVFRLVFALPVAHEAPVKVTKYAGKDVATAAHFKEAGNRAFQHGDYRIAARLYSRSCLSLPAEQKENLSVVFANRSAAFYRLDEHKLALGDADLALNGGYPVHLRYKAYDRRARCLLALHRYSEAQEAFRATLQALDSAKLEVERRQKWQMDVQIMLKMLEKAIQQNVGRKESASQESASAPRLFEGKNPTCPAACSAIRFAGADGDKDRDSKRGRYALANRDIPAGSVVLTEAPETAVLLGEYKDTHCFECFARLQAPIPCPTCATVAFCSVRCRDRAVSTHHKVECGLLDTLWRSGASVTCLMALRTLTQKPVGTSLNPLVTRLVSHRERRQAQDFLHRAHMAVFLVRCLRHAGYFSEPPPNEPNEPSEQEACAGANLLLLLQILQFNAHEVAELQVTDQRDLESGKSVFLGGALYPTLALFNHSCDPGIVRYFVGNKVVARTVKPTRTGEEVAENYGPIYTTVAQPERCATLRKQYWFDCECEACTNRWPLFSEMDPGEMRFRCQTDGCNNVIVVPAASATSFMAQCLLCHKFSNVLKGLKALQDTDAMLRLAQAALSEGKASEALNRFLAVLNLLASNLVPPFRDWSLCQQQVRTCMVALGNVAKLPK